MSDLFDLSQTPDLWVQRTLSLEPHWVKARIESFLLEDLPDGDATTLSTVQSETQAHAEILANQELVFAGGQILPAIWSEQMQLELLVEDGQLVSAGTPLARLKGFAQELLTRERVMLNLLQRLCGIATLTRSYLNLDLPPGFKLLDTRKTTPGLRLFEKYAVAVGGGYNHRLDLSSVIMIKDNHLVAAGGIAAALQQVQQSNHKGLFVELEVDNLEQLQTALDIGGVHGFLLDNMSPTTIKEAVTLVRNHPKGGMNLFLEASGGITRERLHDYAWTGVNGISVGALTTQAQNVDIKLEFLD